MNNSAVDRGFAPSAAPERSVKRMRKGTRSCTECRRRKVRCIFVPGSSVCTHCSMRASECIDQREDVGPGDSEIVQRELRPNPQASFGRRRLTQTQSSRRTPSSQLELEGQAEVEAEAMEGTLNDAENPSDHRPPLISILGIVEQDATPATETDTAPLPINNSSIIPMVSSSHASICETLRSALPGYDEIITTLASNDAWWESFRQKTRAISQTEPVEPLLTFATHAYTSSDPADVATLAVAFARASGRSHRLFAIVDSIVIANTSLTASLGGMECLILLAKTYTDIGQPRRAWLTWRRGLAIAQLMGLHRDGSRVSPIRQRIWLAVYHGDRFTSLLLGLPHGCSDSPLDGPVLGDIAPGPLHVWLPQFVHQCAVMAGQVIEQILSPAKPSFAKAMDLDERMESMYTSAPCGWWDLPIQLPSDRTELNLLVERLLIQFFYFHVRMYIHLPFLKLHFRPTSHHVSMLASTAAARQMLKRYLILRTRVDGASLFDCKTSDFVGFTAAVVLHLGLSNPNKVPSVPASEDLHLLQEVEGLYWTLEQESGCKIASQCRRAMSLLATPLVDGASEQRVPVPYFGSVVRRRIEPWQGEREANPSFQPTPSESMAPPLDENFASKDNTCTDYLGYQVWDDTLHDMLPTEASSVMDSLSDFRLDLVDFDIDQDWSSLFASFATP